jgi:predicted secreted hydrolase
MIYYRVPVTYHINGEILDKNGISVNVYRTWCDRYKHKVVLFTNQYPWDPLLLGFENEEYLLVFRLTFNIT